MQISNKIILILKFSIFFLLLFALWNSLIIGGSWDEPFHHANGVLRLRYLISFGEYQNYQYANNQFYPGLYDTFSSTISFLINKFYPEFLKKNFLILNILLILYLPQFQYMDFLNLLKRFQITNYWHYFLLY